MERVGIVETAHLFEPLHEQLIGLLRGLEAGDWLKDTACRGWAVRDIAAHLLDGDLRRLSFGRDGHTAPGPARVDGFTDLVAFLNDLNADWVRAARRLSPRVLTDLLQAAGSDVARYVSSLDPHAPATFPVAWAGDTSSPTWFDVGREYTEWWHHQQQIREAVGAPGLTARTWLFPALDLFVRVLPHTYRDATAAPGASVALHIHGPAGGDWTLARDGGSWVLYSGTAPTPTATVQLDQDTAWRMFTKGLPPARLRPLVAVGGDRSLGEVFVGSVAVMA
jgi:uncharacterized protein (TIGR03083 family)